VKKEPEKDDQSPEMGWIKAFDHPLRRKVLEKLQDEVTSPVRMAIALGEPLVNVSYHTKVLFDHDCIELVTTVPRRGAVEHFYRAKPRTALGSRLWQTLPVSRRGNTAAVALDDFLSLAFDALENGTTGEGDRGHFSTRSLLLDEAAWENLLDIWKDAEERIEEVVERCGRKLEESGKGFPVALTMAAFQLPSDVDEPTK
jgi:DNA-binding transcriptional ArsR family regulator